MNMKTITVLALLATFGVAQYSICEDQKTEHHEEEEQKKEEGKEKAE